MEKHYIVFRVSKPSIETVLRAIIFLLWRKEAGTENREDTSSSLSKIFGKSHTSGGKAATAKLSKI